MKGDWGDIPKEGVDSNNNALTSKGAEGQEPIVGIYNLPPKRIKIPFLSSVDEHFEDKIVIVTLGDRSETVTMWASEFPNFLRTKGLL